MSCKIKNITICVPNDTHRYELNKGSVKQIDVTWGSDPYVTDSVTITFEDGHCMTYGGNIAFWFESRPAVAVDHER